MSGTAEENKAVVQGSIAYFGPTPSTSAKGTISLRYDGSTYPNWDGDTQERLVSVSGNEVNSWVTPQGLLMCVSATSEMTRLKDKLFSHVMLAAHRPRTRP